MPAFRLSGPRLLLLGALGVLAVVYASWQWLHWGWSGQRHVMGDLFFVPLGVVAAAAAWSASRRCAAWRRLQRAWRFLAVGVLFYLGGDLAQTLYEAAGRRPYPSLVDVFNLLFYPFVLAGLLSLPTLRRSSGERIRLGMDLAVAGLGSGAFIAYVILGPALVPDQSALQAAASIAYPVGDMMLLAATASILLRGSAPSVRAPLRLLGGGIVFFVIADMVYAYASLHSGYHGGDRVDVLWFVGLGLLAVAAAAQPAVGAPEPLDRGPNQATWVPHVGAALALVGLVYSQRHDAVAPLAMTVGVVALGGVVLLRQSLFQRDLLDAQGLLRRQALHDGLTGLPNRHLLLDRLDRALAEARPGSEGGTVALLLVGLDGFRLVNDALGYEAADRLLIAAPRRLQAAVLANETLARIAGDKFAVVVEGIRDPLQVSRIAEHILSVFVEPFEVRDIRRRLGASLGIAVDDGHATAADLLRDAETAMSRAKEWNRGGYEVFSPELGRKLERRRLISRELQHSLNSGVLEVHYQPVVSLPGQRLLAVEALARWEHPTWGRIPPDEFIAIAESTGVISTLGRYVRERALADLAEWRSRDAGALPQGVLVNISPRELRDPDFVSVLEEQVRSRRLASADVGLEVTEGLFIDERDGRSADTLEELIAAGFRLLLDDFGTGYSALASLKRHSFSALKIDRSFIGAIHASDTDAPVTRAAIGLGKALNLQVIAEGVETATQLDYLTRLGCDAAQGFGIGRPAPAADITTLLAHDPRLEPAPAAPRGMYLPAPIPANDEARLVALRRYAVLDTGPEPSFDEIAQLAAELCDTPMAFVSLVDEQREYFKAAVGSDLSESPRDISFCGHGILEDAPLVIPDARDDVRFAANPQVTEHGIQFYAGVPLRVAEGHTIGMLCVKDTRPRLLSARQLNALVILAHQVVAQLELRCVLGESRHATRGALQLADDALAAVMVLVSDSEARQSNSA